MRIFTAAELRAIEQATIEQVGLPGIVLMEHAARAVADAAAAIVPEGGRVHVVCGKGNNAGDGYAAARLLKLRGVDVRVLALEPHTTLTGDAGVMARAYEKLEGQIELFEAASLEAVRREAVIVDAIFGTGLSRAPEGRFAVAIEAVNAARARGARVIAVDLPSGVSSDHGDPPGVAVGADRTITFGHLKRGLVLHPGAHLAGEIEVAEISLAPQAAAAIRPVVRQLREAAIRGLLPRRDVDSHKGTYGHCLVVAGSPGKSGAAALAARAALVGGAGLVTIASRAAVLASALGTTIEAMGLALPGEGPLGLGDLEALAAATEDKAALLVGPGIPRGEETGPLVGRLLTEIDCPAVLDADALNALVGHTAMLKGAATEVVLTPHPGELARLIDATPAAIHADRIGIAQRFAQEHHCTLVLKGAGTVIADPDGDVAICPTGNSGLATAGTGDVLAGLVAALLAQGLPGPAAARAAVYVHGLAAERRVHARGLMGLVASDVIDGIAEVWASWSL